MFAHQPEARGEWTEVKAFDLVKAEAGFRLREFNLLLDVFLELQEDVVLDALLVGELLVEDVFN